MGEKLEFLIEMMQIEFNGNSFNGPSLMKTLDLINPKQAISRETLEGFSVWGVTMHILYFKYLIMTMLKPDVKFEYPYELPSNMNYLPKPPSSLTEEEWKALKSNLIKTHEMLVQVLQEIPESKLDEMIVDWKCTFKPVLIWLSGHDLYHVAMIRNMGVKGADFRPPKS